MWMWVWVRIQQKNRQKKKKKTKETEWMRDGQKRRTRVRGTESEREMCAAAQKIWYTSIVYKFRFFDSLSQYNDDESASNERVSIEKFRRTTEISSIFFLAHEKKSEGKKFFNLTKRFRIFSLPNCHSHQTTAILNFCSCSTYFMILFDKIYYPPRSLSSALSAFLAFSYFDSFFGAWHSRNVQLNIDIQFSIWSSLLATQFNCPSVCFILNANSTTDKFFRRKPENPWNKRNKIGWC